MSSQDGMAEEKEQPLAATNPLAQQILRYASDITCLLVGALVFLWTHDILTFLLLYGIATRQIRVREVIGMLLLRFQKMEDTPRTEE